MTPEAVIYRYLELVDPGLADLDALLRLISSDADLLSRWLRVLQIPARYDLLEERLRNLSEEELKGIADAQVWTVSPTPDSARLSVEQWQSVLRAAFLAEVLVAALSGDHERSESVRLRTLLALSGVHLAQDAALADLITFRGVRPDLLEDAALELRVFVVVDGLELGRDEQLASQVLNLAAEEYYELLARADELVATHLEQLRIESDSAVDWSHRIWLRQQISVATAAFQSCESMQDMIEKHVQVSRTLFARAPLMLLQSDDLETLRLYPGGELQIGRNSASSVVARVARTQVTASIADDYEIAVVDRQLLQRLECSHALVRATRQEPCVVFVVDAEDDLDVGTALELYTDAFERYLPHDEEADTSGLISEFRAGETARLREIVHEANNPLAIVHNYLHILELRFQDDPSVAEQLQLISNELSRAGEIFARARDVPDEFELPTAESDEAQFVEVVRWLDGIHQLQAAGMQARGIHCDFESSIEAYECALQQGELHQILTNLMKNAGEATAEGGRVSLRFNHRHFRNGRPGIEIEVEDTGPGLSEAVLSNLRGPKESTKGGDHQGVGLQLVYRLVAELGADLDLRTSSSGTCFSIFLPTE